MRIAQLARKFSLPAVLASAAAIALAGSGPAAAAATAPDPFLGQSGTTTLAGDVLNHLDQLTATGTYHNATMTIGVSLQRPDAAAENAYLADVYNPASPDFRHFVTVTEFAQRFGVSSARYDATVAWLRGNGLTTTSVKDSTEYLLATGPASTIARMLDVSLNTYHALGRDFFANTSAPTVPRDLGILDITGLQDFARMRTMQQWQQGLALQPDRPHGITVPASTGLGSTTPQDLWGVYDQPASDTGQGEQVAIFGWGATDSNGVDVEANLRRFESTYHLPQVPVIQEHFGAAGEQITDTGSTGEWQLDLPASTGMAPNIDDVHLYFGTSGADPDILAAYSAWDGDANGPRQGSSSFAGCEASPATGSQAGGPANPPTAGGPAQIAIGNPSQDAYEALLKEAVELGRTMFVSTGDLGAQGCPYSFTTSLNGATAVPTGLNNYPSDSEWTTAVGGTVLYWTTATATTPASRFLEYSWTHTGGGTSLYVAAPKWQTDNLPGPGLLYPCTTDWHNPPNPYSPGTLCRGIPDVAAQSGDILTNGYVAGGGTSLSSPLWVGMWARIQAASSNPGRLGFASPAIYQNNADTTKWSRDFFDVGGGSQQTFPSCAVYPSPYSCSHPGWDYLSGWGTPDVTNLMKDLDNGNTSPVAFVPSSSVPETPAVPLLAVLAAGVLVGAFWLRNKRAAQSTM